jgi:hypothetical protein
MDPAADDENVAAIAILAFVLIIGPLAVLYGADSRPTDTRDRRGWWPGAPRAR